jgi:hypothetical protein
MSFLPKIIRPLFGLTGMLFGGGKKPVLPRRTAVTPDVQQLEQEDILRRRRGAAADVLTGVGGSEPQAASLGRLVVGS